MSEAKRGRNSARTTRVIRYEIEALNQVEFKDLKKRQLIAKEKAFKQYELIGIKGRSTRPIAAIQIGVRDRVGESVQQYSTDR